MKIAIIGAGYMGAAFSWPLRDNGHEVNLVGTHLDGEIIHACETTRIHPKLKRPLPEGTRVFPLSRIDEALEGVEVIVSGVNSFGIPWIAEILTPRVRSIHKILSLTKGLDITSEGRVRHLLQVITENFPEDRKREVPVAAIGGPCIAGELAGRRQTCVVFGAEDPTVGTFFKKTCETNYYHIWTTTDIFSLEVSVALKNAYALGVGIAYGMLDQQGGMDQSNASMHNLASAMFAEGTWEIAQFLKRTGGNPEFAYTLPGAGDLYVTTMGGRSVRMGRLLGEGYSFQEALEQMKGETLEAVEIIRGVARWIAFQDQQGQLYRDEFPLMRSLVRTVVEGKPLELDIREWFGGAY
ncbi:MAG: glycerol-3-phosphate dehydrogenase [Spirochaetes bacterium]|nr:glycerol-3-phosphate dehydrogenase [Spirochaetota bacterium]